MDAIEENDTQELEEGKGKGESKEPKKVLQTTAPTEKWVYEYEDYICYYRSRPYSFVVR